MVQFTAKLDGQPVSGAHWSLDLVNLGTFDDSGKLTCGGLLAGEGTVTARLDNAIGTAKVTVRVETETLGQGVPPTRRRRSSVRRRRPAAPRRRSSSIRSTAR